MELLIEGLSDENKTAFQDDNESFANVCEWDGVECNDEIEITAVSWAEVFEELSGSLDLQWMPATITDFAAVMCKLVGPFVSA